MTALTALSALDQDLNELVVSTYHDPLRFVEIAYPWGQTGTVLAQHDGPDVWQRDFLIRLGDHVQERAFNGKDAVKPIRMGVSSGHGIGKSVEVAWVTNWIMCSRPRAQGTITANTFTQLRDKTWASIQRWTKLCLWGHWFIVNSDRMYHVDHKESWFCAPASCKEQNSEAFAGQHALDSTSFYIFDEASAVPDPIFEVAEGGLTDGEPMIFLFGNTTRSYGAFYRACFGSMRHRWDTVAIDSRESKFTNKAQIAEWIEDHGEDSDFVRVRVRGLPPRASDAQFISQDVVSEAQQRESAPLEGEALVCGLDIARGGPDSNYFVFRCGVDARSIPAICIPGEESRDAMRIVTKAADLLDQRFDGRQVKMMFIDGTGIGGPIVDRLKQLGYERRVTEVGFGKQAPDPKFANMRSFMWGKLRDWLPRGCIENSSSLEQDLVGPGYWHDRYDRVQVETKEKMKARNLPSPDQGDALALTFAAPVVEHLRRQRREAVRHPFEGRHGRRSTGKRPWTH